VLDYTNYGIIRFSQYKFYVLLSDNGGRPPKM